MINSLLTIYVEKNGTRLYSLDSLKIQEIKHQKQAISKNACFGVILKTNPKLENEFTKTTSSYDDSYEDVSFFCEWKSCDVFFFYRKA
jgi:hypothetical protein